MAQNKNQYCALCGRDFSTKYNFDVHQKSQHGIERELKNRETNCTICNKSFSNVANLKKHVLIHQRESQEVTQPKQSATKSQLPKLTKSKHQSIDSCSSDSDSQQNAHVLQKAMISHKQLKKKSNPLPISDTDSSDSGEEIHTEEPVSHLKHTDKNQKKPKFKTVTISDSESEESPTVTNLHEDQTTTPDPNDDNDGDGTQLRHRQHTELKQHSAVDTNHNNPSLPGNNINSPAGSSDTPSSHSVFDKKRKKVDSSSSDSDPDCPTIMPRALEGCVGLTRHEVHKLYHIESAEHRLHYYKLILKTPDHKTGTGWYQCLGCVRAIRLAKRLDATVRLNSRTWRMDMETGEFCPNVQFVDSDHQSGCQPVSWMEREVEQLRRAVMHDVEQGADHAKTHIKFVLALCAKAQLVGIEPSAVLAAVPYFAEQPAAEQARLRKSKNCPDLKDIWTCEEDQLITELKSFFPGDDGVKRTRFLSRSVTNKVIILCAKKEATKLARAQSVFLDATFRPLPYKSTKWQLFTIHAKIGRQYVPLLHAFMEGKTAGQYEFIFNELQSFVQTNTDVGGLQWRRMTADFELQLWTAVKSVLPDIKVYACLWHYARAIRSQKSAKFIISNRKQSKYHKNAAQWFDHLRALPLVHYTDAVNWFKISAQWQQSSLEQGGKRVLLKMFQSLRRYYNKVWLRKESARSQLHWGHDDNTEERTNNPAEAYHSSMQRAGRPAKCTVAQMLVWLRNFHALAEHKLFRVTVPDARFRREPKWELIHDRIHFSKRLLARRKIVIAQLFTNQQFVDFVNSCRSVESDQSLFEQWAHSSIVPQLKTITGGQPAFGTKDIGRLRAMVKWFDSAAMQNLSLIECYHFYFTSKCLERIGALVGSGKPRQKASQPGHTTNPPTSSAHVLTTQHDVPSTTATTSFADNTNPQPNFQSPPSTTTTTTPRYLMLPNPDNKCFGNALIQFMLHLDQTFWDRLMASCAGADHTATQAEASAAAMPDDADRLSTAQRARARHAVLHELWLLRQLEQQSAVRAVGNSIPLIKAVQTHVDLQNTHMQMDPVPLDNRFTNGDRQHDSQEFLLRLFECFDQQTTDAFRVRNSERIVCMTCGDIREPTDDAYFLTFGPQYEHKHSLQQLLPDYPIHDQPLINCPNCTNEYYTANPPGDRPPGYNIHREWPKHIPRLHSQVLNMTVPDTTDSLIVYYQRHINLNPQLFEMNVHTVPNVILLGTDAQTGLQVQWRPSAVVSKQGAQNGGHYWSHRFENNEWYKVNDANTNMPVHKDIGQMAEGIYLLLLKKVVGDH